MNWTQIKDNKLAKFSINANLTRKAIYKIEYCEVSAFWKIWTFQGIKCIDIYSWNKVMISDRHCPNNKRRITYEKIRVRKYMVGFTIACQHILNNQTMHLSVWSNGPMLAQSQDLKPNLWQNMQLVQRRANVCNLTPLNILTNAILTVLVRRKSNIVWPTPTCIRHPNILPKLAQYVHADWVFILSYIHSIWMFNARDIYCVLLKGRIFKTNIERLKYSKC